MNIVYRGTLLAAVNNLKLTSMALALVAMTIGSASSLEMYTLHGGSGTGTGKSLAAVEVDVSSGNVGGLLSTGVLEDPGGSLHGLACGFEAGKLIAFEYANGKSQMLSILESRLAHDIGNEDTITARNYHAAALDPTNTDMLYVTTDCTSTGPPCQLFVVDISDRSSPVEMAVGGVDNNGIMVNRDGDEVYRAVRIHDIAFALNPDGGRTLYGISTGSSTQLWEINENNPSRSPKPLAKLKGGTYEEKRSFAIEGELLYALTYESPAKLRVYNLTKAESVNNLYPLSLFGGSTPTYKVVTEYDGKVLGSPAGGTICPSEIYEPPSPSPSPLRMHYYACATAGECKLGAINAETGESLFLTRIEEKGGRTRGLECSKDGNELFTIWDDKANVVQMLSLRSDGYDGNGDGRIDDSVPVFVSGPIELAEADIPGAAAFDPVDPDSLYVVRGGAPPQLWIINMSEPLVPALTYIGDISIGDISAKPIQDLAFAIESDGTSTLYGATESPYHDLYQINKVNPQLSKLISTNWCVAATSGTPYPCRNIVFKNNVLHALSHHHGTGLVLRKFYLSEILAASASNEIAPRPFEEFTVSGPGVPLDPANQLYPSAVAICSSRYVRSSLFGPVFNPARLQGGASEIVEGNEEGSVGGIVRTISLPVEKLAGIPKIIWRLEAAYLTMNSGAVFGSGELFANEGGNALSSCTLVEAEQYSRSIECLGSTKVGASGDIAQCKLRISLVALRPEGEIPAVVAFKNPDAFSMVPYLDVSDLIDEGVAEFSAQIELLAADGSSAFVPAKDWFDTSMYPASPRALYDADVTMAFYYDPVAMSVPCPESFPSSFKCAKSATSYLALDKYLKPRHEHESFGAAFGMRLARPGTSVENSNVVGALSELLSDSSGVGVWFAGTYNALAGRWELPDGTPISYPGVPHPEGSDICAFYDGDTGFEWANDSCDSLRMAIFDVPPSSFEPLTCCEAPLFIMYEDSDSGTVTLSLAHPTDGSTQSVTFSVNQAANEIPTINFSASAGNVTLTFSTSDGESQDATFSIEDADASITNEIQALAATTNATGHVVLELSDPFGQSAASTAAFSINDSDSNPNNEIQDIFFGGDNSGSRVNYTLTDPQGNQTGSFSIEDADADAQNEIQDIVLNGSIISIDHGSSLDLSFLNGLSLPFYIVIGENARKNVFGHPFGATSFAAPYNLTYVRHSVLVSEPVPDDCSLFVGIALGIYSDELEVPARNTVSVGDAPGPPGLNITSGEVIGISSVAVGGSGNCNSMNSETAMVLLIFRVVGY